MLLCSALDRQLARTPMHSPWDSNSGSLMHCHAHIGHSLQDWFIPIVLHGVDVDGWWCRFHYTMYNVRWTRYDPTGTVNYMYIVYDRLRLRCHLMLKQEITVAASASRPFVDCWLRGGRQRAAQRHLLSPFPLHPRTKILTQFGLLVYSNIFRLAKINELIARVQVLYKLQSSGQLQLTWTEK